LKKLLPKLGISSKELPAVKHGGDIDAYLDYLVRVAVWVDNSWEIIR